jgi:predicted Abi (CAAX) family protease
MGESRTSRLRSRASTYYKGTAAVLTARPKVAELVFQVYGRPLHPELFQVYQTQLVQRADYEAKIDITSAGHVVTWRYAGLTLTEVAASAQHPLPERRRLMNYSVKGERSDALECRGKVRYEMSFQLEPVDPEVFWTFQAELARDGQQQGMLHQFGSSGRMALGALSFINVEPRARQLLVQAFHTFPDDYAIVKTQSLFQLP